MKTVYTDICRMIICFLDMSHFFKYEQKYIQNCNSTYRSDSNIKDFNIIVKSECAMYEDDRPTNE